LLLKRIFTLLFFIGFLHISPAQNRANIWYFGYGAGLDFNGGVPFPLLDGQLSTREGCATISDNNGNLLFYSDGSVVYNRDHVIMQNGTGLMGDVSSTHSSIIVPKIGTLNQYYIFTVDVGDGTNGLQYSVVDMNLDGGLGGITTKNIMLENRVTEKVVAYKKTGLDEYWVVSQRYDSNEFLAYDVSATGVNPVPVLSSVGIANSPGKRQTGQIKISLDGKGLAIGNGWEAQFFNFDEVTGKVSNPITLLTDVLAYGVEFSPDSNLLYISYWGGIDQFNLSAGSQVDILNSKVKIKSASESGSLQLGPDKKIYAVKVNGEYLDVIHNPDVPGLGCDFRYEDLYLGGRRSFLGLPTFISNITTLKGNISTENTCYGDITAFAFETQDTLTSITWDFGDGTTTTVENPTHTYTSSGDYTITVNATSASGTSDESIIITISDVPVANPVTDIEVCSIDPNPVFDLSTKDMEVLGGQSPLVFDLEYYPTLADAVNRANLLPLIYTNTNAVETLYARVHNKDNKECYDITSFNLIVKEAPTLNAVTDWTVCDTDADGLFDFDLSQKNNEIYNGQDTGIISIAYFETQANADANTNPIGPNFTNTIVAQDIFYRIQNTANPECYETGSFKIEVITGVTANTPNDLIVCDDDNDGLNAFDLSLTENEVLGTQNPASLNITYHTSLMDAENGGNQLANTYENVNPYTEIVYIRVENIANTSCYNTSSFELKVYDTPILQQVGDWQICDTGNNGVETFDLTEKNIEILGGQSATNFDISYYNSQVDADAGLNAIVGSFDNIINPQQIFYRVENVAQTDCYITGSFALELFYMPTAGVPVPLVVCDTNETGVQTFDLSAKDTEVLNGLDANSFSIAYFGNLLDAHANQNPLPKQSYTNSALQETIYARIENNGLEGCYDITPLEQIINPLPQPSIEEIYVICPDSPDLVIDGGAFGSWSWQDENKNQISTNRTIDITALGDYTLTVTQTQNGVTCEKTVPFEVVSSGAPEDFTTEIIGFSDTVTLEIEATGIGDFEYSIDGINYQDTDRFEVFPGEHTIYVRDRFLCRTLSKVVIALGYQKFFTPNGDGSNEHWNIIGAGKYPGSQLYIYDRYGKLVHQVSVTGPGWDGTYNGIQLPSSDYWFRYVYDNGKVFTGHFTLKR